MNASTPMLVRIKNYINIKVDQINKLQRYLKHTAQK